MPVSPDETAEQLDRILQSAGFQNSQRLRRFLKFAVHCVLSGATDQLKESVLGRVVFDRGSHYDPRLDSIVRVESQRLRRKLEEYYATDGRHDLVSIAFRSGSYVPVVSYASGKWGSQPHEGGDPSLSLQTVAVLPLDNQSSDPEQEFLCDGITEEVIYALSRIPGLSVIGRTSVFALKGLSQDVQETGMRLGAGTIVSGGVRKVGKRIRISVEMVDSATREIRWVGKFDKLAEDDVFEVEEQIAASIARILQMTLAPAMTRRIVSGAPNMDAYLLYLKARHKWNAMKVEGYRSAIELFEQAIERFPSYAALYAGLADAHSYLALWGGVRPRGAFPMAKQAARQALHLNPLLPHAYSAMAGTEAFYEWNWSKATSLAKKAIEMEPSYAFGLHVYGCCLLAAGKMDDARTCFERAVTLDPLSQRSNRALGWSLYLERRFAGAEKWLEAALVLDPQSAETRYLLVQAYLGQHRYAEALDQAQSCDADPPDPLSLGALGACLGYLGRKKEAAAIVTRLAALAEAGYVDPCAMGQVQISLGNADLALECVGRSLEERTPFAAFLKLDPAFDSLRALPRFNQLTAQLRL